MEKSTINTQPTEEITDRGEQEFALVDILLVLTRRKKVVLRWTLIGAVLAVVISAFLPVIYEADSSILPPQQSLSSASSMLGQLGGLLGAGGAGGASLKNPSDLWIDILKSRIVADAIIQKFDLQTIYRQKRLSDTEKVLAKNSSIEAAKDGVVTITVRDRDSRRAADLANEYVDELYKQNQRLVITEAGQRRLFFEQRLAKEEKALADAEVALKQVQMKTGIIELRGQTETAIRSIANLQAEIANREVQKEALLAAETAENPDVKRLQQEIEAMNSQLNQLQKSKSSQSAPGDIQMPASNVPDAALAYVRQMRELKYHETLFELLARQLEAARIDESKSAPIIQVIDSARVPDHKAWPPRAILVAVGTFVGLLGGIAWILMSEGFRRSMQSDQVAKWRLLKYSFGFTRHP